MLKRKFDSAPSDGTMSLYSRAKDFDVWHHGETSNRRLTEVGEGLTSNLKELRDYDNHNQAILRAENSSLMHGFDPSAQAIIGERYKARCCAARLFQSEIEWSEMLNLAARPCLDRPWIIQYAETSERCKWLEKFRSELLDETAYIESHNARYEEERVWREEQITAWEAELDAKQDCRFQVIKLVLKFKAENFKSKVDKHIRRQVELASAIRKVAALEGPSFPPELRLQIIECVIRSQLPYWPGTEFDQIESLIDKCFTWSGDIAEKDRTLLRKTANGVLFDVCIVKLDLEFAQPLVFKIPPPLEGKLCNIRQLALELEIVPSNAAYHRGINRGIEGMPQLGVLFPRLKVCVVMLLVRSKDIHTIGDFVSALSNFSNLRRAKDSVQWKHTPLRDSVVDFIASFLRHGPGRRKLVRLSREGIYRIPKRSQPLIEAKDPTTIADEQRSSKGLDVGVESSDDEQGSDEDPFIAEARHIFDTAFSAQVKGGDKMLDPD